MSERATFDGWWMVDEVQRYGWFGQHWAVGEDISEAGAGSRDHQEKKTRALEGESECVRARGVCFFRKRLRQW